MTLIEKITVSAQFIYVIFFIWVLFFFNAKGQYMPRSGKKIKEVMKRVVKRIHKTIFFKFNKRLGDDILHRHTERRKKMYKSKFRA